MVVWGEEAREECLVAGARVTPARWEEAVAPRSTSRSPWEVGEFRFLLFLASAIFTSFDMKYLVSV